MSPSLRPSRVEPFMPFIQSITSMRFAGLSQRGLVVLARLRGLEARDDDPVPSLVKRLKKKEGVFAKDEIGFGYVTDSPKEAVDLIVRSLPAAVRSRLKPSR